MTAALIADPLGAIKTDALAAVSASIPGGLHIGSPTSEPSRPWAKMWAVADVIDAFVPWQHAMVQFDCYSTGTPSGSYREAAAIAYAIANWAIQIPDGGPIGSTHVSCGGAQVTRIQPSPDKSTQTLRCWEVDVRIDLMASGQ